MNSTTMDAVEDQGYVVKSGVTGNYLKSKESFDWTPDWKLAYRFPDMNQANDVCYRMGISNYRVIDVLDLT